MIFAIIADRKFRQISLTHWFLLNSWSHSDVLPLSPPFHLSLYNIHTHPCYAAPKPRHESKWVGVPNTVLDRRGLPSARHHPHDPGLGNRKGPHRSDIIVIRRGYETIINTRNRKQCPCSDSPRRRETPASQCTGETSTLYRRDTLRAHGLGPRAQVLQAEWRRLARRDQRPGCEEQGNGHVGHGRDGVTGGIKGSSKYSSRITSTN